MAMDSPSERILDDGRKVTAEMVKMMKEEEMQKIIDESG